MLTGKGLWRRKKTNKYNIGMSVCCGETMVEQRRGYFYSTQLHDARGGPTHAGILVNYQRTGCWLNFLRKPLKRFCSDKKQHEKDLIFWIQCLFLYLLCMNCNCDTVNVCSNHSELHNRHRVFNSLHILYLE